MHTAPATGDEDRGETRFDGAGAGIDLRQFHPVFFEEAAENLDRMEAQLLEIDLDAADDEELNSIFRCAHSVKGGAATFGFADVCELTHRMETLLDKLRRRELAPTTTMVDLLLRASDALRAQLARHQGAGGGAVDTAPLLLALGALGNGRASPPPPVEPASTGAAMRVLELGVGPLQDPSQADDLVELFNEIPDLGTIESIDSRPACDGVRRFRVATTSTDSELLDLFTFHVAREQVRLRPWVDAAETGTDDDAPAAQAGSGAQRPSDYGFFDGAPGAPDAGDAGAGGTRRAGPITAVAAHSASPRDPPAAASALEPSTLRVPVEKVDQLINLVGELVITQAMLAQHGKQIEPGLHSALAAALADLDRNTRELQVSVMAIRMIPMSVVFKRFPRMLRDLAARLGKKVEFSTRGEATELDKGLIEKITDPLTHLLRNSCDHGIELPAERLALGKPEHGSITLAASHQGGSILIEVSDDGRGLTRATLIAKAREHGIDAPDSMTDAEAWNLVFAPGFSTAGAVTEVSGRGVGMDVVKKNITALGGTVDIDSAEGYGMSVKVRLPLTLAIMDGMSVGVGDEVYILPLASVVESRQVEPGVLRTLGGSGRVVEVRDQVMPVLELARVFDVPRSDADPVGAILVVAEADGGRVALLVDQLLGQQQVVVKNLEANYRRVDDVSGATILGDGRVALILDVGSLVRRSRH